MKKYELALVFVTLFSVVSVLALQANPQFWEYQRDYYKILPTPGLTQGTVYRKDVASNCQATQQYRYNENRTGVAPETAMPKPQAKIVRHIQPMNIGIHGASKSSPTVDETGVYVGSDSGQLMKLDHDGNMIWQFFIPGSDNGIHGSAALDDKKVYIGAYNGLMYALEKSTGALVWATPVGEYIGASPLLAQGALFISVETSKPDGFVAKLDCNTGDVQWVSEWLGGHSHSSPSYDESNSQVIAGANSGRLFAFATADGRTLWKVQIHGPIKSTPMIHGSSVYFSAWDENMHAHDLKTGKLQWTSYMGGKMQTSLSLLPGLEMGVSNTRMGELVGIDLASGNLKWRLQHGDSDHMASVLVTRNPAKAAQWIAWSRCKENQLCALDGQTGKLLHNIELPGSFTSVPYAFGDKIYVSLDSDLGFVILQ